MISANLSFHFHLGAITIKLFITLTPWSITCKRGGFAVLVGDGELVLMRADPVKLGLFYELDSNYVFTP